MAAISFKTKQCKASTDFAFSPSAQSFAGDGAQVILYELMKSQTEIYFQKYFESASKNIIRSRFFFFFFAYCIASFISTAEQNDLLTLRRLFDEA